MADNTSNYDPSQDPDDDEDENEDDDQEGSPSDQGSPPQAPQAAPSGPGAAPPSGLAQASDDDLAGEVQRRMAAIKAGSGPAVDLGKYSDAEGKARQDFLDQKNQNNWQSLAQLIGNGLARYGAAKYGQAHHVDTSHIDMGPGIDYNDRTKQAMQDYQDQVQGINRQRESALRDQQENYGMGERALQDLTQQKRLDAQDNRLDSRQAASDARQAAALEAANDRQDKQLAFQSDRQDKQFQQQATLQDSRAQSSEDKQLRREGAQDLDKQAVSTQQQLVAAGALGQQLQAEGEVSGKSLQKLKSKDPDLVGKAGVTNDQLDSVNRGAQVPGKLWGTNTDTQKAATLYDQQVLAPLRKKLDDLRQQKQQLLSGASSGLQGPAAQGPVSQGSGPAAPSSGRSTPVSANAASPGAGAAASSPTGAQKTFSSDQLTAYAQKYYGGDEKKAHDYLASQGYSFQQ